MIQFRGFGQSNCCTISHPPTVFFLVSSPVCLHPWPYRAQRVHGVRQVTPDLSAASLPLARISMQPSKSVSQTEAPSAPVPKPALHSCARKKLCVRRKSTTTGQGPRAGAECPPSRRAGCPPWTSHAWLGTFEAFLTIAWPARRARSHCHAQVFDDPLWLCCRRASPPHNHSNRNFFRGRSARPPK